MTLPSNALLLVAHPGHELLLYGWMQAARPLVCVLTDGSGHSGVSRLHYTRDLLASLGAREGAIFGRFTDREIYSVIREGRVEVLEALVDELAGVLRAHGIDMLVVDAMEGFNPVHDLCRILGGAAADRAGSVLQLEYPVHDRPESYRGVDGAAVQDLDDATLADKLHAARAMSPAVPDVAQMLAQWGDETFRVESLRPVRDWTARGWPLGERPLYERTGEERVAASKYDHVIRYDEHFAPLLSALRSKELCAS
jgi:hypothetical protein